MMMIALFILPILLDSAKAIDHTLKNDENLNKDLNELLEKGKWFAFSKSMKMCSSLQSIDNN